MFGPVITTEAHLAYAGVRIHSHHTAVVNSLSFLGLAGPVVRDSRSCIFLMIPSTLPVSACALSNQERTFILGSRFQRLLLQIQLRLRLTLQHIYSHAQNLANDCADHAARTWYLWLGVESKRMHALDASFVFFQYALRTLSQPW